MRKVEKIREEIKKRYEYWKEKESNSHSIESESRMSECQYLLLLFDSLQEEPVSNDLEEAAYFYVDTTIEWFDSEGNPCCYPAFIAGAQWQKEKMMENAVDSEIYFNMNYLQYHINTEPLAHFHHGDKVKLIIIKEE